MSGSSSHYVEIDDPAAQETSKSCDHVEHQEHVPRGQKGERTHETWLEWAVGGGGDTTQQTKQTQDSKPGPQTKMNEPNGTQEKRTSEKSHFS